LEIKMFSDEALEQMVYDAFDELCSDQGLEGTFAADGPISLALVPDPFRLGAAVDLWMRIESREEFARHPIIERTTIFGSSQLDAVVVEEDEVEVEDEEDEEDEEEDTEDTAEAEESAEPMLDELELRGRLLVDVVNTVSQYLSDRRGALELGEDITDLETVQAAMLEAINLSFSDARLGKLWYSGTFLSAEEE
jgi:hypothetical protein